FRRWRSAQRNVQDQIAQIVIRSRRERRQTVYHSVGNQSVVSSSRNLRAKTIHWLWGTTTVDRKCSTVVAAKNLRISQISGAKKRRTQGKGLPGSDRPQVKNVQGLRYWSPIIKSELIDIKTEYTIQNHGALRLQIKRLAWVCGDQ